MTEIDVKMPEDSALVTSNLTDTPDVSSDQTAISDKVSMQLTHDQNSNNNVNVNEIDAKDSNSKDNNPTEQQENDMGKSSSSIDNSDENQGSTKSLKDDHESALEVSNNSKGNFGENQKLPPAHSSDANNKDNIENLNPIDDIDDSTNNKITCNDTNSVDKKYDSLKTECVSENEETKKKSEENILPQKTENGSSNLSQNEAGIVDLGDDSDEEMQMSTIRKLQENDPLSGLETDYSHPIGTADESAKKSPSVCSDSDGAVVIASDSETELSTGIAKKDISPKKTVTEVIDDDDDDCVVIEDDTPTTISAGIIKRKSAILNSPNHIDDSQPPSKRLRGIPQPSISQITIKDARSLQPQEVAAVAAAKKVAEGAVYPINITSATNINQGPPKLVPMTHPTGMPLGTFPGLGSNTNLLPGLTDDMYVLEAPSFIVPYIYEKPPTDNLKDIVRDIEMKYKLTKEDLAEADKSDEFDMITEQNKEDKDDKNGKKKKKRRAGDDADDSWSEESEEDEDDDDDDSESGVRTKVLIKEANDDLTALKSAIKPAAVLAQSPGATASIMAKPGQENYFESPLGKFFMDIGVGLVQEFVQSDLIRLQKRKMRKSLGKNITEFERAISALSGNLEASKKKNAPFKFTMKRCEFCNFKSESALAMANHYETPHMNGPLYKCNFCTFEIRNATEIVYHMEAMHNIKARLIKPLPYHQCPNCGFEDNGKAKLARHQPVCAKKFRPELNLSPPNDWEAPAKIPRIKPRHGLVGTATAYQAMAAQAAAQKAALASIQQQQQAAQARSLQAAALAAQNAANKIRGRPPTINKPCPNNNVMLRGSNQVRNPMATNVVLPNNYQVAGGQLIQTANTVAKKTLTGQPSISITPLPRQNTAPQIASPSSSKTPPSGLKPGQSPSGSKAQFVICEICDGYIKDLEQLRNHMQWMHKVKIHPKMIYNRPPLNCQKCQFRFFTDQGLERHLLGSHGLVTSSMQEAANKGKDAGRCPVCGRMYQWKLLNHVSRDHHMTLKPAHLSYKCTVCTATFGMYKQFETHVYTAHSTVAKKAMDGKKNNTTPGGGIASSSTSNQQRSIMSNDSLLKPLKINDEITIIPQPASKPRLTNLESHVID